MNSNGQVTLLVLLLGILGMTVAISAVSRSIQDVRQSTQTTSGTRSLAAAEAGLEKIISQPPDLNNPPLLDCSTTDASSFTGMSTGELTEIKSLSYLVCKTYRDVLEIPSVSADQVAVGTFKGNIDEDVQVFWSGSSPNAVAISVLDNQNNLYRFSVNSFDSGLTTQNQFLEGEEVTSSNRCGCDATFTLTNNYTSCFRIANSYLDSGRKFGLVRVRPLYLVDSESVSVGVCASNKTDVFEIVNFRARAVSMDETTREVQRSFVPNNVSGIFDYSIFTSGSLTLN